MSERRQERQRQQRRLLLERAMDCAAADALERQEGQAPLADVFFPEHQETLALLGEMLERVGLQETCLALARHQEEDRDHWLRRLAFIEADPGLRARREVLDRDYLGLYTTHFQRWGAAGPAGERSAAFEAGSLLGALRTAERLWVAGQGRPPLPVLVQEALALLWPALYPHVRRHAR
jgi:hypothetical protein